MSPDAYCQEKAAASGSSFYYSFFFLTPARRRAITAFYAYCREIDDVVDESSNPRSAALELAWWRSEIDAMLLGKATHPVTLALFPHLQTYNIERDLLMALIDGMEMDLKQQAYPDFAALAGYCWHVAGVVGIVASRIFGATQPQTRQYAEKLGLAFQLTNIIRDVGDDIRLGRIYLPADELAEHGVESSELMALKQTTGFTSLMRKMALRAHAAYDEAFAILPAADRKAQRPGLVMAAIYRSLLVEIEKQGFPVLSQRTSLSTPKKLWLAISAYLKG